MPPPPRHAQQHQQPQYTIPPNIASGVAEALRNPYALNQFHNPYSAHYMSAYMQSQPALYTTQEGYALSSAYNPCAATYDSPRARSLSISSSGRGRGQGHKAQPSHTPRQQAQQSALWYQAGSARCTYPRCSFGGSPKSVETHMMDRHLVFPSGWDKKKGSAWDADPSLKGKPVPIQGTSIVLNTPAALDAWVAERKKRWPTTQRVQDKNTKIEEAISRGQLPLMGSGSRGKRRYEGEGDSQRSRKHFNKGKSNQRNAPRVSQPDTQASFPSISPPLPIVPPGLDLPTIPAQVVWSSGRSETDSEDNGTPEAVSSKKPVETIHIVVSGTEEKAVERLPQHRLKEPRKKEPRHPPRNPFASRPTLLRNLLLPEIRMTVSNLSQAIRFLVDNDFLRDAELKPGQASHNLIELLGSTELIDASDQSHYKSVFKPDQSD